MFLPQNYSNFSVFMSNWKMDFVDRIFLLHNISFSLENKGKFFFVDT